jgi:prolyl oligopeptidase
MKGDVSKEVQSSSPQKNQKSSVQSSSDRPLPVKTQEQTDDPFVWLEEIEGKKALDWVHTQNNQSVSTFQKDDRYTVFLNEADTILNAKDKIPYGSLRGGYVYNFWQDDQNIRGVWRRTTLKEYRKTKPTWETILDLDVLAKTEKKNWVYKGAQCLPPTYNRCMLRLSNGGTDASVYREFDIPSKRFVVDGFVVPSAKSDMAWFNQDTLLLGTKWGKDSLTQSGYPRSVKLWKRGTKITEAKLIYEGESSDVGVWPSVMHEPGISISMISRALTFFTSQFFLIKED